MKLLLTSSGLNNKSIIQALLDLVGKGFADTSLVYIPTASNVEVGDKSWMINDLVQLQQQNFKDIDIADISAVGKEIWLPKFQAADVLFFEGGNQYHLMKWMNKSGLSELLVEMLKTKVYVGVSAGSMVLGNKIGLNLSQTLYEEDLDKVNDMNGHGLVNFYFLPHLHSEFFSKVREEAIKQAAESMTDRIYALDDASALKIVDGDIEIVSEGQWLSYN